MKNYNYLSIAIALLCLIGFKVVAQNTAKNDLLLSVNYFNNNNQTQYLVAHTKCKIEGKFQLVPNVEVSFYITNDSTASNLLGKAITNEKGEATLLIPPSAKSEWIKSPKQNFEVVSKASTLYDETKTNTSISKAKLKIETSDDKKITVTVLEQRDTAWTIVKGVELKIAIKRLDGDLNVNETQSFTTDSTGTIVAEFKRDSLPGDAQGNLTIVAKVEDNDNYGNLNVEKTVPWGNKFAYYTNYERRTLFARRGHSPIWLELLAYSIIIAVWIILIFLIAQIRKIKRLGNLEPKPSA